MTPEQVGTLYAYNAWANARLLEACAALPGAHVERDLGTSHRSLGGTLRHIVWGEWLWLARWQERSSAGAGPLECTDVAALRARWTEIEREQSAFIGRLTSGDLARAASYENPRGTRWTYTLGQMLQHVVNHSTYHRGQVAAMLRQLGVTPPATDYLVYLDELAAPSGPGPRS